MKLKVGQVYLWKDTKSLFGKLIDFYNRKTFGESGPTHVGIVGELTKDGCVIYEALESGFEKNPYEKWWIEGRIAEGKVKILESKIKLTNVKKNAEKYLGTRYGWWDIFKIGLNLLTGYRGFIFSGNKALICSEAVAKILYDSSNKKIQLGYNPKYPGTAKDSEFDLPFDLISPMHINLSKSLRKA